MGEEKKKGEGGENNVVLKVDCSCDGCATKIRRCLRSYPGVENVKAESDTGKITVTGKVSDPAKMKEKLEEKLSKKVLLISPQIKKDKNNKNGDHNNKENKSDGDNKEKKSKEKEKEKETPVMTTAVLKVALHCQGCVDKIRKTVSKTKGVNEMEINKEKDTVTVQGTMDVKALAANLTEKLKRKVEVVPPKKPDNKENNGGGGDGKKNKGGGGGGNNNNEEMVMMEQNRMEYMAAPHVLFPSAYGYGYAPVMHPHHPGGYSYMPGYTYPEQFHLHAPPPPPQIFSDENPHACSLM